jgi:hypothetical protein
MRDKFPYKRRIFKYSICHCKRNLETLEQQFKSSQSAELTFNTSSQRIAGHRTFQLLTLTVTPKSSMIGFSRKDFLTHL